MATAKNQETTPETSARGALLFEMDSVALGARKIRYEVLANILQEQGITLTPILFSRYCLHPAPSIYMPAFLEAVGYTAATPEQVVERLMRETTARLMQKSTTIDEGLVRWMEAARERGAVIACASMLTQEAAESLAAQLEFSRWQIKVFSAFPAEKGFPRADHWIRMAKAIECPPRRCVAIVSTMATAKSALAAMMNVVVRTDEFTEYQDFSGVNLICSDLKDVNPHEFFGQIQF